jgi:signal transduction histidine kinase
MTLPVRWRLTLAFACVMAVLLAATGVFIHQRLADDLDSALDASLRSHAADVAALAQQSDTGLAEAQLGDQRAQLAQIVDRRGRVIDATAGARAPLLDPATLARARRGGVLIRHTRVRLLAVPVRAQGQQLVVIVGQQLDQRDRAIADLTQVLLVGGPAALVLAALAGYLLAGAALRPVEVMRRRERAFVADASHELRTPLTMLRTELELMARDRPSGPELQAATASAIEETARLGRLADDLLVLTQADHQHLTLHRTPVAPATLLEAAAARARRRGHLGVRLTVDAPNGLPPISGDSDRLTQALDNILDNAVRHAAGKVRLTARHTGARVELHVLDDGPGFPVAFLPRAWERFSRPDAGRTDGGAGLGLSIVRTIAELHRGRVGAANRPGGGADVWISLPAGTPAPTT